MKLFFLFAALLGLASCAVDLSGHWQSPECSQHNVGFTRTISRFTSSTFSVETLFFSDADCTDLVYTKIGFGSYNLFGTYRKTLYVGTSSTPVTTDFDIMSFGHAKQALVPANEVGVALLNGIVATASTTTCPSASMIGPFGVGELKDMTYLQCDELGTSPITLCPTVRTLVYQDTTTNTMYIARGTQAKLCSGSFAAEAVFNDNNCAGDQPGCVVHSMQLITPLDYVGEWELPCRSVNITTPSGDILQMSENGRITLSRTQLARKIRRYFSVGCPTLGARMNLFDYGAFQVSRQVAVGTFMAEYAPKVRSLLAPNEDSAVQLRQIVESDAVCLTEIKNITAGYFSITSFATCQSLGLKSQGSCPVHYTTLRLASANQMYLSDENVGDPCSSDVRPYEVAWTRVSASLSAISSADFGTAVPQLPFSAESQARFLLHFFFSGIVKAEASGDFSFVQSLITDDFVLEYPGDPSFIAPAGEYNSMLNEPKYAALARFLQAWHQSYSVIVRSQYHVLGQGDEYSAAAEFTQTVQNVQSKRTVRNIDAVWIFKFKNGLISRIDVQADTLALAIASCPSSLMCGQSPPVTLITTISTSNITTVTNNIYNNVLTAQPSSPSGTDGDLDGAISNYGISGMNVYVGLAAIILVLAILAMFGVLFIARNVSGLQLFLDQSRYSFRRRNSDEDLQTVPARAHVESPVV